MIESPPERLQTILYHSLFTIEAPAVAKAMAGQAEDTESMFLLPDRETTIGQKISALRA